MKPVHVTIWNEFVHEREKPEVAAIYPNGIHGAIAEGLQSQLAEQVVTRTATLDQPAQGLPEEILNTNQADMCGMTRALISDPQMPNKAQANQLDDIRA